MERVATLFECPDDIECLNIIRGYAESPAAELVAPVEIGDSGASGNTLKSGVNGLILNFASSDTGCLVAFEVSQDPADESWDIFAEIIAPEVTQLPALKTENFDELRH